MVSIGFLGCERMSRKERMMIHIETNNEDKPIDYPILKQHCNTGCIAIFNTVGSYVVVDQGNQFGELFGTLHNIKSSDAGYQWDVYNGEVRLFNV